MNKCYNCRHYHKYTNFCEKHYDYTYKVESQCKTDKKSIQKDEVINELLKIKNQIGLILDTMIID